ncbi:MAG: arylsulfatase [Deltaproteobacteria bacterium]|nr:arylsulfatase [Deltaproteobacteria bacterium]MBW2571600.1 arylsulfatase [Deltaproteobacteria bacterium]MBW2710304.1 arylsulfatase [Deltaproteobacteria bacterium]
MKRMISWKTLAVAIVAVLGLCLASPAAFAAKNKPNILIIWGDDVGYWNLSHINRGMMGYQTPNIDRIANEGLSFTDYYGEQSCTAGRAAFITGQIPVRTGNTKVGMPGAPQGLQKEDPTIAELLKPLGYMTGQFGKNHLGDRNEFFPTVHGFDEFFGNLYHLNVEEEPELPDYPTGKLREMIKPRGVFKCTATDKENPEKDPRFGAWGNQVCEDTGPLTQERMKTVDEEFLAATKDFIQRAQKDEKPFFVWFNATRMHVFTHLKDESKGKTGHGIYPDGMVEHDGHVGELLDLLDELKIADNTIVMYGTDNGAEVFTWPDGGTTPFHGEKATCWEGGFRVPAAVRWPGKIPAGKVVNGIVSHQDWMPTLLAAAGESNIKEKLLKGHKAGKKKFKVHLDGYNMLDYFKKGGEGDGPRKEIFYFTDVGELAAVRYEDYKVHFMIQEAHGFDVWKNPYTPQAWPSLVDLRADPFERGMHESIGYSWWATKRMFSISAAAVITTEFMKTFLDFPPRQEPGSFSVDGIIQQLEAARAAGQ